MADEHAHAGWSARAGDRLYHPKGAHAPQASAPEQGAETAPIIVRLGVPYVDWPMEHPLGYGFGREDDRFSPELHADLQRWCDKYADRYDENGWTSEAIRDEREREGMALRRRLQEELGPRYRVTLKRF